MLLSLFTPHSQELCRMTSDKKISTDDIFEIIDDSKFYIRDEDSNTVHVFFSKKDMIDHLCNIKLKFSKKDNLYIKTYIKD